MSKRRSTAIVSAMAMLGALSASPAAAAPEPPPAHQAGRSAFTPDDFTVNRTGPAYDRAVTDAREALTAHKATAKVKTGEAFTPRTVVVAKNGAADVRFDRTYRGLPVYGGDLIVHLTPGGAYRAVDTATPARTVSTTPEVAAGKAASTSREQLKGSVSSVGKPHLAIWSTRGSSRLVWETVVRGTRTDRVPSVLHVLADARTGQVVTRWDEVSTDRAQGSAAGRPEGDVTPDTAGTGHTINAGTVQLDLTQSGGTWTMRDPSHGNGTTTNLNHAESGTGTIFSNTTGTFGDGTNGDPASEGADAHYGAAETFDYYKTVHGRNGIFDDGKGVPSRTHYGNDVDNAFWDGTQMTYGDGPDNAHPHIELDVAGHEMSHGVSGALVGWEENGETGGLNEGTSDIFGTMVEFYANNAHDKPDYDHDELITDPPLRNMYNPSLDGHSPNCYASDNGTLDAHYSLGPLTHWFFLLAVGSGDHGYGNSPTCDNSSVSGIGNDKADKIWYRALASYANSNEDYADARVDSLKAAADLYGTHCSEYNTVNAAWAAVSVTGSDPVPGKCPPLASNLAYTGPTSADYHDAFTASAKLTAGGGALSGETLRFSLGNGGGSEACSAVTNSSGVASCSLTPNQEPGSVQLTVSFAGSDSGGPASISVPFTINKQETTLAYTGPPRIANATPAHFTGTLKEGGTTTPVAGRTVTFAIGTGTSRQTCTDTTDASGKADCVITPDQPLNAAATVPLAANFAGDAFYLPSSASATLKLQYMTGRAYGLTADVHVLLVSLSQPPTPDTGEIRTADATTTNTPCGAALNLLVISASALCPKVTTTVGPGTSSSTTSVDNVTIGIPGIPVIKATGIKAASASRCTATSGSVAIATLSVGGVPVTIPSAPNSKITLPGVGTLTVNEQTPVSGADAGLTVNGLHLNALGGTVNLVIASATSDAHNCV